MRRTCLPVKSERSAGDGEEARWERLQSVEQALGTFHPEAVFPDRSHDDTVDSEGLAGAHRVVVVDYPLEDRPTPPQDRLHLRLLQDPVLRGLPQLCLEEGPHGLAGRPG